MVVGEAAVVGPELATVLQEHVKQVIAPYKYPRQIECENSLPKTGTGKIQRFRLREQAVAEGEYDE